MFGSPRRLRVGDAYIVTVAGALFILPPQLLVLDIVVEFDGLYKCDGEDCALIFIVESSQTAADRSNKVKQGQGCRRSQFTRPFREEIELHPTNNLIVQKCLVVFQ